MNKERKPMVRRHAANLIAMLDGGKYVDIQNDFTWSVSNLTDRQRLFIFYYTYPFDNSARGNGAKAAKLAGFTKKNNRILAKQMLQMPEIQREMGNLSVQITKNLTKLNMDTAVSAFLADKIKRAQVKPFDYYNIEERTSDTGYKYTVATPKLLMDLTEEQKSQILDIEYVGAKGLMHYKLPNKQEVENEVIKLWRDLGGGQDADKDTFEVETTAEIIKGNLAVKTKVIEANRKRAELAGLTDNASGKPQED